MLDKIPTPLSGATCNEKSGWLPANFDDQCREILTDIVKRLLAAKRKDESESVVDDYEVGCALGHSFSILCNVCFVEQDQEEPVDSAEDEPMNEADGDEASDDE